MQTAAIILAAGKHERWGDHPKQLVSIDSCGRSVIGRTIDMLSKAGIEEVYVVTHSAEIIKAVGQTKIIRPETCDYLTDSILSSRQRWTERTIILLGDVYFSDGCFDKVLNCREEIKFFGVNRFNRTVRDETKKGELYALIFDVSARDIIEENLKKTSALAKRRDENNLWRSTLIEAIKGDRTPLETLIKTNYPAKPPLLLRKCGFKRRHLWKAVRWALSKPRRSWMYGKLWGMYFCTAGIGPFDGEDYGWPSEANDFLQEIDDLTRDIDRKEDFYELLKELAGIHPNFGIRALEDGSEIKGTLPVL